MEYAPGEKLDDYIDTSTGPIPEKKAILLFNKMLDAVGHAHSRNIIHRDIKPSNFIITKEGEVKILDFGIAKILDGSNNNLTKSGTKVGTALYMSPQQVRGQVLDRRTDIYSLGVVLFQMLTGHYPYDETESEYELYTKIVNEELPNAKDFYVGISDYAQTIIAKATAKKPLDRYQSCLEFKKDLLQSPVFEHKKKRTRNTQIIETAETDGFSPPILSHQFWQNLLLILISVVFVAAISIGAYQLMQNDIRHVLDDKQTLYSEPDLESEKTETLNYGETVKVLTGNEQINDAWMKVISLRGNAGYIPRPNLALPKIYEQINAMFGNNTAQSYTSVLFKKALRNYFIEEKLMYKSSSSWLFFAEEKKEFEFNSVAIGDFNNNELLDFACVLADNENSSYRLLIFLDNKNKPFEQQYDGEIKIKQLSKGKVGGRWYLGNKNKLRTNKYEYLSHDGILLFRSVDNANLVYLLNLEENILTYFEQPN